MSDVPPWERDDIYPEDDDAWDLDDEWTEAEMNCGRLTDWTCTQIGSEYCDFGCPFRDLLQLK
jgi:hypothetical protein